MGKSKLDFDKYRLYRESVQAPAADAKFIRDVYKELRGKFPEIMCEDFCGTFAISCEWVKLGDNFKAHAVDLDPEPIAYGKTNYWEKLKPSQRERLVVHNSNVLSPTLPKADIIVAMNFSHYIFKNRKKMLEYFRRCYERLRPKGVFLSDCFGGSACLEANEEEMVFDHFSYYWDQVSYDPITNNAMFYIHFKPKGMKKQEKVFTYDWRMWTIPELQEVMEDAGFKKSHVYWEGTTKSGEGDGNFKRQTKGEECESFVAYIAAEK